MCTCGGHACPVHRRETRPFAGSSEYHDVFKAHDMQEMRRDIFKQQREEEERRRGSSRPRTKFDGVPKSRLDYQPPPVEALKAALQQLPRREQAPRSRAPLDDTTSYKADYPWKQPVPIDVSSYARCDHLDTQRERARFEGETSYQHDYYRKELPPQMPPPSPAAPLRPRSKFEGISQTAEAHRPFSAEDYRQAVQTSLQSPRPDELRSRRTQFEGTTTAATAFAPPPREAYRQFVDPGPARVPAPSARFGGESEYAARYPAPRAEQLRAALSGSRATEPLRSRPDDRDFATTAGSTYRAPPARPPCPAGVVVREHPPPTPPFGREHIYFDREESAWY